MTADKRLFITVYLVVSPCRVRQVEELAMFNRERLELTASAEGL